MKPVKAFTIYKLMPGFVKGMLFGALAIVFSWLGVIVLAVWLLTRYVKLKKQVNSQDQSGQNQQPQPQPQ